MATFPALKPVANRSYRAGNFPVEVYSFAGMPIRFLNGTTSSAHELGMAFELKSEADVLAILNHYSGQAGPSLPFALSAETLQELPQGDQFIGASYLWLYTDAPKVELTGPNLYQVTINLVSTESSAQAPGASDGLSPVQLTVLGGQASSAAVASAATVTVVLSTSTGTADGFTTIPLIVTGGKAGGGAAGADLSVTLSLRLDGASGEVAGAKRSITVSCTGNGATGGAYIRGVNITNALTPELGNATGGATTSGTDESLALTLSEGAATGE